MTKTQKVILAILIFGNGVLAYISREQEKTKPSEAPIASTPSEVSEKRDPASQTTEPTPPTAVESLADRQSLEDMTQTLFQYTRPDTQLRDLVDYLERSRQEPMLTRNENADTGEMVIVRTKSPLPGTRYFHAQYVKDENDKGFVQHMSFEFKPGPEAMNQAQEAVRKFFPNLSDPQDQKEDFVKWNLDQDHILWIKRMGPQDLKDDPFNAYSKDDVGTIRVAVEVEIHNHSEN
ncbi:MAG: hypothetical protein ACAH59_07150 [Pseudobdellovibrionaceae bacterium]